MLFFLILFIIIYYFSYGWLYRIYLVDKIAILLKKRKKRNADLDEIEKEVGREIDNCLRDEIDDRMGYVDGDEYDEQYDGAPFKLFEISAEDIFNRFSSIFDKKFGDHSLKLYKNFYTDSISSMLTPTIILSVLFLNLIASKFSIYFYFANALLALNFDDNFHKKIYKFFGRITLKLFRYKVPYALMEEEEKPQILTKDDYLDYIRMDSY